MAALAILLLIVVLAGWGIARLRRQAQPTGPVLHASVKAYALTVPAGYQQATLPNASSSLVDVYYNPRLVPPSQLNAVAGGNNLNPYNPPHGVIEVTRIAVPTEHLGDFNATVNDANNPGYTVDTLALADQRKVYVIKSKSSLAAIAYVVDKGHPVLLVSTTYNSPQEYTAFLGSLATMNF